MTLTTKELEDVIEHALQEECQKGLDQIHSGVRPEDIKSWAVDMTLSSQKLKEILDTILLRTLTQSLVYGSLPNPSLVLKTGFVTGLVAGKAIGEANALKTQLGQLDK